MYGHRQYIIEINCLTPATLSHGGGLSLNYKFLIILYIKLASGVHFPLFFI